MKRLILIMVFILAVDNYACTTAIVSGKYTIDGRPILWKHRDSDEKDNVIRYFNDGKYYYVGLVNANDKNGESIWAGCNEFGFAIMNSASYNLIDEDTIDVKDREGIIMKLALGQCKTLQDFENLLKSLPKPLGVEANFGVIDAYGGAAYYETDNFNFTKIDVNDAKIAPFGYVIRTNYSFTGDPETGYGYIRFNSANTLFYNAQAMGILTPEFIFNNCSRSLFHSLMGIDLTDIKTKTSFVPFQDYIPRYSSVSSIVIHGIKPNENLKDLVMYSVVGFPLTSVAIPVFIFNKNSLPKIIAPDKDGKSELCNLSLTLKKELFPITRGSGVNYIKLDKLTNNTDGGILKKIQLIEKKILELTDGAIKGNWGIKEVNNLYNKIDELVPAEYEKEFNIKLNK